MPRKSAHTDLHHSRQIDVILDNGPVIKRSHTDIFCCLLFLAAIGGFVAAAVYAVEHGDPKRLVSFLDSDGRICGDSAGVEDYPYLYFPIVARRYIQFTVCVKECPRTYEDPVICAPTTVITGCTADTRIEVPDPKSSRILQMDFPSSSDSGMGGGSSGGDSGMGGGSSGSGDTGMGGGSSGGSSDVDSGSNSGSSSGSGSGSMDAVPGADDDDGFSDSDGGMNMLTNGEMDTSPPCTDQTKCPGTVFAPTDLHLMGPPMDPGFIYPPETPKRGLPFQIYNTTAVYGKICIPNQRRGLKAIFSDEQINQASNWVDDIRRVGPVLLVSVVLSVVLGIVYFWLVRHFTAALTWFMIIGSITVVLLVGASYLIQANRLAKSTHPSHHISQLTSDRTTGIILCTLAFFMVVFLLFSRKKIRLAIKIIKSSSKFISDTRAILFVPFLLFFALIGFAFYWFTTMVYLWSIGDAHRRLNTNIPLAEIKWNETAKFYMVYLFFPLVWILAVFVNMGEFIVSSATSQWYFKVAGKSLTFSFIKGMWYHLGTVACYSLLMTVTWPIRFLIEGIVEQFQKIENSKYAYFCKCCISFFDLFELVLQYFSEHTLIHVALTGDNYKSASTQSFSLVYRHISRFSVVGGLGKMFTTMGAVFISSITTYICYSILGRQADYKTGLSSPIFPTILCGIVSFVIGSNFMSVYGESIESILYCYSVDEEIQKEKKGEIRANDEIANFFKEQAADTIGLVANPTD